MKNATTVTEMTAASVDTATAAAPQSKELKPFNVGRFTGRRAHLAEGLYWSLMWLLGLTGFRGELALAAHKVANDAIAQLGDTPIDAEIQWGKVKKSGIQSAKEQSEHEFQAAEATRWARRAQDLYKVQKATGIKLEVVTLAKEDVTWWELQHKLQADLLHKQGFRAVMPSEDKPAADEKE